MLLFLMPSPDTISAHINTETSVFINNNSSGHFMTPPVLCLFLGTFWGQSIEPKPSACLVGGMGMQRGNEALTTGTILTHHQKRSPAPSRMVTSSQSLNESNPAVIGFNA